HLIRGRPRLARRAHLEARQVSRVLEERRGDLAARPGEVRLAHELGAPSSVDKDFDSGHRARLLTRLPARSRPMSLSSGSIASTTWSSTPSARSTWATLRRLTVESPVSILRKVSRVMSARSATCCAVRPRIMRQPRTCPPRAASCRSILYPAMILASYDDCSSHIAPI